MIRYFGLLTMVFWLLCCPAAELEIVGSRMRGRGVAVSVEGKAYVVTAAHVLLGNPKCRLIDGSGREYEIVALEFFADRDLVFLEAAPPLAGCVPDGGSSLRTGQPVFYGGRSGVLLAVDAGGVLIYGGTISPGESGGAVADAFGRIFAVLRGYRTGNPDQIEAVRFDDLVPGTGVRISCAAWSGWQRHYLEICRISAGLSRLESLQGDALVHAASEILRGFRPTAPVGIPLLDRGLEREYERICAVAAFLGISPDGGEVACSLPYGEENWEQLVRRWGSPAFEVGRKQEWGARLWSNEGKVLWATFCRHGNASMRILLSVAQDNPVGMLSVRE